MTLYYANSQPIEPISYTGSHRGERIITWFNRMNDIKEDILSSSNSIPLSLISSNTVITQYLSKDSLGIDTDDSPNFGGVAISQENYEFSTLLDQFTGNVTFNDGIITGKSFDIDPNALLYHSNSMKFDTNIFTHYTHYVNGAFSFSANGISYVLGSLGIGRFNPEYEVDVLGTSSFSAVYERNQRVFSPSNQPTVNDVGLQNTLNVDHVADSGGIFTGGVNFSAILNLNNIGSALDDGFNLENITYENILLDVDDQDGSPGAMMFNNDGTKMFMVGLFDEYINQYSLSTAYNISTASFVLRYLVTQDTQLRDMAFNSTGTKMYVLGWLNDRIYQYSLGTAYDVSSVTYDNISFHIGSGDGQDGNPNGFVFNNDGTKMFLVSSFSDGVHQYTLSTPFDMSTASYDSLFFYVGSQAPSPWDLAFNTDGSKMFILDDSNDRVHQYSLSSPFDITTVSYDSISFDVSPQDTNLRGLAFNNDGTKMYVSSQRTDFTDRAEIYQYRTFSYLQYK